MFSMQTKRAEWVQVLLLYVRRIFALNVFFLILGALWRLLFMDLFGNAAELKPLTHDVLKAFLLGARFDLTILCYINSLPLLAFLGTAVLLFSPRSSAFAKKVLASFSWVLTIYYLVFLILISFINIVDINFYSFYQDRINVLVFGFITDDTMALIRTIWKDYPVVWVFLALIIGAGILFYFLRKIFRVPEKTDASQKLSWVSGVIIFISIFLLNGVGARGSLGLFPLGEMDTGISSSAFVNQLCFNSTRALARAFEVKQKQSSNWDSNLKYFGYGDNYRQAFADYFQIPLEKVPAEPADLLKHRTPVNAWAAKTKPHVIILVMESFGTFWLKYNSPEFNLLGPLQKHFDEDQYLTNFLSSTPATIGSLSSLMVGSMQRPISEFLSESMYLQVPFHSAPAYIYKKSGYKTRFVYGGNPGWREINKFAKFQSFETVEGQNEIFSTLGGQHETHDWGVYDEDIWEYLWQSLQKADQPQFIVTMTTTNHPPFQLPSTYQRPTLKIPEALLSRMIGGPDLARKRFDTYRYSTQKLADFLDRIKHSPLKDKVIVAVTGDHNFWMINFNDDELMQKSSVPFYLYMPAAIRKNMRPGTFGSHPDILPTLYNLSLSDTEYESTATDLLADGPHYAFDYSKLILGPQGAVMANNPKDFYYNWEGPYERLVPADKDPAKEQMSLHYKSLMGVLDYYMKHEKDRSRP